MPVGAWSAKFYGYDLPWLLWDVGNFDWFFSVLLCGHLALTALGNDLFYHAVHCGKPVLLSQRLLGFRHPGCPSWCAALITFLWRLVVMTILLVLKIKSSTIETS